MLISDKREKNFLLKNTPGFIHENNAAHKLECPIPFDFWEIDSNASAIVVN
jgi:hypothetical protein